MPRRLLLIVAPGAGLGHLTRACAVARQLARLGVDTRILSHSPYAAGLQRLTGCAIDFIPASRWVSEAPLRACALQPGLVVLDTFPWGLRGEWRGVAGLRFVTLARRLNVNAYEEAMQAAWEPASPTLARIIACESLAAEYGALLERSRGAIYTLPGRIRFPAEEVPTPVPRQLAEILARGRTCLVIHSGPVPECELLLRHAQQQLSLGGGHELAVIAPQPIPGQVTFEYFPAARLYPAACRIVTAGGYNSVAELASYPQKRLCLALPRRYDDQSGRLADAATDEADGAPAAALVLRDLLDA